MLYEGRMGALGERRPHPSDSTFPHGAGEGSVCTLLLLRCQCLYSEAQ